MEFRITASNGESVKVEAPNWMMAMGKSMTFLDVDPTRMGRWVCTPKPDGEVHVEDPSAGKSWVVLPLEQTVKVQASRPAKAEPPAPPRPRAPTPPAATPARQPPPLAMPLHTKPKPHKAPSVLDTFDPDRDAPDAVITPSGEDAVAATFEDTGDDDTWGEDDTAEMSFFRSGDARDRLVQSGKELSKAPKAKALQMALDLVVELVPCEAASIATGSADDPHLTYAVASGPVAKQIIGRSVDWGEGLVGLCFECGIPVEIDDVSRDDRHLRQFDDRTGFRTRSMLCVPVRDAQTTYGVIQLVNLRWATDDNTVASVQGLAKNLASALAPR